MLNDHNFTTISLVSGKGGVGKTTLALAIASELCSANNRVLIVDLDFSNRGLSEFLGGAHQSPVTKTNTITLSDVPQELADFRPTVCQLDNNFYVVKLPISTRSQLTFLESQSISEATRLISDVLTTVLTTIGPVDVVILDCHGSRDTMSYAACAVSRHVIVVSTDEKITFFGTLSFVRDFTDVPEPDRGTPRLHLVFNRLSPSVRGTTLFYWYKRHFRQYFEDADPLATIPTDPHSSIAASREVFPTSVYRYSNMANKCRLLVSKLFNGHPGIHIAPETRFVTRLAGFFLAHPHTLFSTLFTPRLPFQTLITLWCLVYVATVFLRTEFLNVTLPDLRSAVMLAAGAAITTLVLMSWMWMVWVCKGVVELDGVAAGDSKYHGIRDIYKTIGRTLLVCVGAAVLLAMPDFFQSNNSDSQLLVLALDQQLGQGVGESLFRLLETGNNIGRWIAYVVGAIFGAVFATRLARTVLFRIRSSELLYRVFLAGAVAALWGGVFP